MVQWAVKILSVKSPELITFGEEMPTSEKAARVSITQLSSDVASLQKEYTTVQGIVDNFPDQSSKFVSIMKSFLVKAKEDLEQINKSFKAMEEGYADAVGRFMNFLRKK